MLTWQERFNIGVESIDNAHQELFRIINKLHNVVRTGGGNAKWTAAQTIKYVRSYTLKHFQDEETYMLSINFRDYEAHKAIHATMREKIIPHLYSRMEREDYSDESIKFFLSVLEKWLTRHIIGHDREIVQKALSDAAGEDGAQPEMKTAAGNLPGASRPTRAELSSAEGRGGTGYRRGVFLLAMTLVIFGAAYAAGGLLVKSRVDRLDEGLHPFGGKLPCPTESRHPGGGDFPRRVESRCSSGGGRPCRTEIKDVGAQTHDLPGWNQGNYPAGRHEI